MDALKEHVGLAIFYEFRKDNNATKSSWNIYVYKTDSLNEKNCQKWSEKFRKADFTLKDAL